MAKKNRSTSCSCGSGKKYKKCCMVKSYPRFAKGCVATVKTDEATNCKIWDRKNWQ